MQKQMYGCEYGCGYITNHSCYTGIGNELAGQIRLLDRVQLLCFSFIYVYFITMDEVILKVQILLFRAFNHLGWKSDTYT